MEATIHRSRVKSMVQLFLLQDLNSPAYHANYTRRKGYIKGRSKASLVFSFSFLISIRSNTIRSIS